MSNVVKLKRNIVNERRGASYVFAEFVNAETGDIEYIVERDAAINELKGTVYRNTTDKILISDVTSPSNKVVNQEKQFFKRFQGPIVRNVNKRHEDVEVVILDEESNILVDNRTK